jgi:hypothetical protein
MNSPTPQYRALLNSLRKAKLVTGGVNKLGCQTDLQHLKLQSYILLCHSALEEYLENIGLSAAETARKTYKDTGVITKTLVSLISAKLIDDISEKSKAKIAAGLASDIEEFSKEAFNKYRALVQANNGIVDRDQDKILVPIGVNPKTVDLVLRNNLHAFGGKRGDVAHKFKVRRTETLTAVETDLTTISTGLLAYDSAVCETLKSRMK